MVITYKAKVTPTKKSLVKNILIYTKMLITIEYYLKNFFEFSRLSSQARPDRPREKLYPEKKFKL